MDRHLVSVEVGVEGRTNERMDPDGLPLHEDGLERLDSEAMQGRRAVQEHRVVLDDVLQDLVDLGIVTLQEDRGA